MKIFKHPTDGGKIVARLEVRPGVVVEQSFDRADLPPDRAEAWAWLRQELITGHLLDERPELDADDALDPVAASGAAVDAARDQIMVYQSILGCSRAQFDAWLAAHSVQDALWAIVLVLRYLLACKDRSKAWLQKEDE